MARRKAPESGGSSSEWLNTYADMVTLLLTFFILLFSMSSLDASKFNLIVKAFSQPGDAADVIVIDGATDTEGTRGLTPTGPEQEVDQVEMEEVFQKIAEMIEQSEMSESVDVETSEGQLFMRFRDDMMFEPNSAVLRPETTEMFRRIGNDVKTIQNQCEMISIHGHTAAIPDNPDYPVSDRILSTDRANAVLTVFEDNVGIAPEKLFAVGWGKTRPISPDSNNTEDGRAQNRRVEILISSENLLAEQLDNVYEKLVE